MFTTPLVGVLRRAHPDARIDFAVGAHSLPAIEAHPLIDNRISTGRVGAGRYSPSDLFSLANRLHAGRYDAIFIPDRSPLLALAAFLGGIRTRVGLDSGGRGLLYSHRVPVSPNVARHEADLYLDLARALDLPTDRAAMEYTPPAAGRKAVLAALEKFNLAEKLFVLIHPGGGRNPGMTLAEKRWPSANFAQLATRLMRETGLPVALVGGLGDDPILDSIKGLINIPLTDFGALPWGQIGALAERCVLYVGNDTGATHMAVGAGTRVVMIMGPTDPRRYAPFGNPDRVAYVWREWNVPAAGARAGAPGFSWQNGASVEDVFQCILKLLLFNTRQT